MTNAEFWGMAAAFDIVNRPLRELLSHWSYGLPWSKATRAVDKILRIETYIAAEMRKGICR
jgi:hypothetical protein